MTRPKVAFKTPGRTLMVGQIPRVVGTLSSLPESVLALAADLPSDVVEIRLDAVPLPSDWLECGRAIQASGWPVILTIRLNSEGGKWTGSDTDRLDLFRQGL